MYCQNCGKKIDEGGKFCEICAPIVQKKAEIQKGANSAEGTVIYLIPTAIAIVAQKYYGWIIAILVAIVLGILGQLISSAIKKYRKQN